MPFRRHHAWAIIWARSKLLRDEAISFFERAFERAVNKDSPVGLRAHRGSAHPLLEDAIPEWLSSL